MRASRERWERLETRQQEGHDKKEGDEPTRDVPHVMIAVAANNTGGNCRHRLAPAQASGASLPWNRDLCRTPGGGFTMFNESGL